jgi:cell wall assembly regulator SMI1
MQVEDYTEEWAPFDVVREVLRVDGLPSVEFSVEIDDDGAVVVLATVGNEQRSGALGEVTLVEGALPEPYRRKPAMPSVNHPRGPVDPAELERILRRVWPDGRGMTDAEIDAAQERLGVTVPPEARVLYRVTAGGEQRVDHENFTWDQAVPFNVWALEDPRRRESRTGHHWWWPGLARTAGTTAPHDAVQALSHPPAWFVLGTVDSYHLAIDLVPGPAGKVGQVIGWTDETRGDQPFGAHVLADSLLAFVRENREKGQRGTSWTEDLPEYGEVTVVNGRSIEDVVGAELEVLYVVKNADDPVSIAPAVGLPRLRTLIATPGSIVDPVEIGGLDTLEYLETGVAEWRVLLDADAVPRSLLACQVSSGFGENADVHDVAEVTDRIRALWGLAPAQQALTVRGQVDERS